ncbi:uncharacterized protein TNCV_3863181 [Trichonephila clavipes]|uniref:Tc1-like transposase DDE domain-containing protein n=1 Tax=Trichonephila clavipes TaxID=2585209 RepID=A0A8X6S380_TRICX|nr:uncharacterized protein TNCV_3863181 [Trichonephila clavipes]
MGWYWISLSHSSSMHCRHFKQSVLHLLSVGASCPSLPSGLGHSHISTFVNHQIELLSWPARSPDLSPIETMWSMIAQRLTQNTPPATTPDQLWKRVEDA